MHLTPSSEEGWMKLLLLLIFPLPQFLLLKSRPSFPQSSNLFEKPWFACSYPQRSLRCVYQMIKKSSFSFIFFGPSKILFILIITAGIQFPNPQTIQEIDILCLLRSPCKKVRIDILKNAPQKGIKQYK